MTSSLTSSIRCLCCVSALVLLIGPLRAAGDAAANGAGIAAGTTIAALPPAGSTTTATSGADERVPLSVAGARLGAIVLVTGADVHITRPDGTETTVRAARPQTVADARDRDAVAIVHDGEAWVRARELAGLLGTGQRGGQSESGPDHSGASFETFEVQKPTVAAPVQTPTPAPKRARLGSLQVRSLTEGNPPELMPVPMSLEFSRMSILSGQDERGFCLQDFGAPRHVLDTRGRQLDPRSPFSPELSYLSLDMGDERRRYGIGDMFDPLFGTATGIGFSSALSAATRAGAALVLPATGSGEHNAGELTLRTETLARRYLTAEAAVASDGTRYGAAVWNRPEFSFRTSLLQSDSAQRQDIWWRLKALPLLSFFGRSAAVSGDYDASTSAFGVSWDTHRVHASLERANTEALGKPSTQDALSLSFLRGGVTGIVRYLASRQEGGRDGLEWSLSRSHRRGYAFLSSSAPQHGPGEKRSYRAGAAVELKLRLRLRAALAAEVSRIRPEFSLEYRPSQDQIVSVSYGAFDTGTPDSVPSDALIVQAALSFGGPGHSRAGIGEVSGRVTDDAGQGVADVAVSLDDASFVLTKADGSYQFSGLESGRHSVQPDPNRIPADYTGAAQKRVVYPSAQEAGHADFLLTRLCRISGQVYAESDATREREGLPGVVIELSSGSRTTTDSQGRYSFSGLMPGSYAVSTISGGTEAEGTTPIPPTSWSFRLKPGEKASGADFGFLRRERPVIFGQLGPS